MAWRLAGSLITFRDQVNAAYPGRNKASDGTIGDSAHASRVSDHNPNSAGVVTAIDITHDPAHGLDIWKLAQALVASGDPRIKYIIVNRKIWEGAWHAYSGSNPHETHMHLSVKGDYDNKNKWSLTKGGEVADRNQVNNLYKGVLMREGDPGGLNNYTGKDANTIVAEMLNSQERKNLESYYNGLKNEVNQLKVALENEQKKPPKEVVKEVEKIVEKIVEIEKPVYVHDQETKDNVSAILTLVKSIKGLVLNLFKKRKG